MRISTLLLVLLMSLSVSACAGQELPTGAREAVFAVH